MNIFIAGANGYIGSRLVLTLTAAEHQVYALVKNTLISPFPVDSSNLTVLQGDLLKGELPPLPNNIDVAFYLVHAMSYGGDFPEKEARMAENFLALTKAANVKQIIYLSGLVSDKHLSPHLASRYHTECLIKNSGQHYTVLRAGIIIGSGSASFEIIRDLVEKLPIMIAPKWVNNLCQPIGLQDVLRYLTESMLNEKCFDRVFDIGGPEQLTYRELLLGYAKMRKLKRRIYVVPVLTPRLSSYWLYFVTSVNFSLARSLVDSLKNEAICKDNAIKEIFPEECLTYEESLKQAVDMIEQNPLIPSWKDALISPYLENKMGQLATVPSTGCFIDKQNFRSIHSKEKILTRIWSLGGHNGWYMNWAWKIRGFIDKLVGGVGLQRGRYYNETLAAGASLDFWRVITADRERGHLLLYAEMKVPGEAWLEFRVEDAPEGGCELIQTASFRPKGLWGNLYWYLLYPFHYFIFRGMAKSIAAP